MQAIFKALPGLIDELERDEAREAIVFAIWPTVLGVHLREHSAPLQLEGNTLRVAVSDSGWEREFKEHASEIVYKLNRALGTSAVQRISPRVDAKAVEASRARENRVSETRKSEPVTVPNLIKASEKIADTDLRKHFLEAAAVCIDRRDMN